MCLAQRESGSVLSCLKTSYGDKLQFAQAAAAEEMERIGPDLVVELVSQLIVEPHRYRETQ